MEATDLITEAKALLSKAEETVKNIEHPDAGQLRIVVARLRAFVEQHGGHAPAAAEPEAAEPADEDDGLEDLLRDDLNQRAEQEGIEDPEKLPNKGAVIDAIRAALAEPADEE